MNTLPDIAGVDFRDVSDICGYASLLFATAGSHGMFSLRVPRGHESEELRSTARQWVSRVDDTIGTLTPGDTLSVTAPYDLIHRLAYGRPAPQARLDRLRLRALEARIAGDPSVDEYDLYLAITRELRNGNQAYRGRARQWHSLSLDRWHSQFRYGVSIERISDYDTIMRVGSLLDSDLRIYDGDSQAAYKHRLFTLHRHYLDLPAAPDATPDGVATALAPDATLSVTAPGGVAPATTDLSTLTAIGHLLTLAAPRLSPDEFTARTSALRHALLTHPRTNRYLRTSMTL